MATGPCLCLHLVSCYQPGFKWTPKDELQILWGHRDLGMHWRWMELSGFRVSSWRWNWAKGIGAKCLCWEYFLHDGHTRHNADWCLYNIGNTRPISRLFRCLSFKGWQCGELLTSMLPNACVANGRLKNTDVVFPTPIFSATCAAQEFNWQTEFEPRTKKFNPGRTGLELFHQLTNA